MNILNMVDYRTRRMPSVAYLEAAARRSDENCLNREHLAKVLAARFGDENSIDYPTESLVERFMEWWLALPEWKAWAYGVLICVAISIAAIIVAFAPIPKP